MKLLASVRNLEEAVIAAQANVDVIDLKEPARGALGMVTPDTARAVCNRLDHHSLSLALGELCQFDPQQLPANAVLERFAFLKIGLSQCNSINWTSRWQTWCSRILPWAEPVLVAYADHRRCAAPSLQQVVDFARVTQVRYFLIDTFCKDGPALFDYYSAAQLHEQIQPLLDSHVCVALAGSLKPSDFPSVQDAGASIIGLRGALCEDNDRGNQLSLARISDWQKRIGNTASIPASTES